MRECTDGDDDYRVERHKMKNIDPGFLSVDIPRKSKVYWSQFSALLKKNGTSLYGRACSSSLLMFAAPTFILILFMISLIPTPAPLWTSPLSAESSAFRCRHFDTNGIVIDEDCYDIVYGPVGENALVDQLFTEMLNRAPSGLRAKSVPSRPSFASFLSDNQGHIGMAVYVSDMTARMFRYALYSPSSSDVSAYGSNGYDDLQSEMSIDGRALEWQTLIEGAAISVLTGTPFDIDVTMSGFEELQTQEETEAIYQIAVVLVVMLAGLILMLLVNHWLLEEKSNKLLQHLRQMGMSTTICWLSFYCIFFVAFTIPAAVTSLALMLFTGGIAKYIPMPVLFMTFWAYYYSSSCWSLFIGSWPRKAKQADSLVFLFFIIGVAIGSIIAVSPPSAGTYYRGWLKYVLDAYAPIGFSKIYGQYFMKYLTRENFEYSEITEDYEYNSIAYSWSVMFSFGFAILPISVYLNLVTDGELSYLFFMSSSFWTGRPAVRKDVIDGDAMEKARIQSLDNAVIGHKLSKTYNEGSTAVKEFSIFVPNGVVYTLLGPNGAGKTTLINMLIGAVKPSNGAAYAFGARIDDRPAIFIERSSVCPQDNRLWPELTVIQHMEFVAGIKSLDVTREYLDRLISLFDLEPYRHVCARALSGGTKRRLCLAMACIGNPHILFLDEPTTGLDPMTRRTVWNVLEKIKMTEADVLSDNIAIMMDGRLRAIGSPMFLKNRYGSGYQISLVPESGEYAQDIVTFARSRLPHAEVELSGSGISQVVSVTIPTVSQALVPVFLKQVHQSRSTLHIKEWGLQHSTLEQAFLRITSTARAVNGMDEELADGAGQLCSVCKSRLCDDVLVFFMGGRAMMTNKCLCSECADQIIDKRVAEFLTAEAKSSAMQTLTHDEVTHDDVTHDDVTHDDVTHDDVTHDDVTHDDVTHDDVTVLKVSPVVQSQMTNDVESCDSKLRAPLERMHTLFDDAPVKAPFFSQVRAVLFKNYAMTVNQKGALKSLIITIIFVMLYLWLNGIFGSSGECVYLIEDGQPSDAREYIGSCDAVSYEKELFKTSLEMCTTPCYINSAYLSCGPSDNYLLWHQWGVLSLMMDELAWSDHVIPVPALYHDGHSSVKFNDSLALYLHGQKSSCSATTPDIIPSFLRINRVDLGDEFIEIAADELQRIDDDDAHLVNDTAIRDDYDSMSTTEPFRSYRASRVVNAYAQLLKGSLLLTFNDISHSGLSYDIKTLLRDIISDDNTCPTAYPELKYDDGKVEICPSSAVERKIAPGVIVSALSSAALLWSENDSNLTTVMLPSFRNLPLDQDVFFKESAIGNQRSNAMVALMILFIPYVFGSLVPIFTSEHHSGVLALCRQMGMRMPPYIIASLLYSLTLGFMLFIVYYGSIWVLQLPVIEHATWYYVLASILLLCVTETGTSLVLSALPLRRVMTKVLGYMWSIITMLVALLVLLIDVQHNPAWYLYPYYNVLRIMWLGLGGAPGQYLPAYWSCVFLLIEGVVMVTIGLIARNSRVKASTKATHGSSDHSHVSTLLDDPAYLPKLIPCTNNELDDSDVSIESGRVKNSELGSDMLQVIDLCKTYDGKPPKKALNGVTFGIPQGECFGLLGPNGAGKSTCISVLTAFISATNGVMFADGNEVCGESHENGVFGICMQDDHLFDELTTEQTLLFYARIKGCSKDNEHAAVQSAASLIGLDGDAYHQVANTMSGGMKRRLSLACAVIGRPKIIVLDEPTSGLDPETRKDVWSMIRELKRSSRSALLLTTHSMEEADALSDRIAIMADGRLKCIGSAIHLKSKFGEGYRLNVNIKSDIECAEGVSRAMSFIKSVVPGATLSREAGRSLVFTIPSNESTDMPKLFADMESSASKCLISVWALAQASLQDVFMNVVGEHDQQQ